jgi:type I restriction enzyme, S subunit
MDAQTFLDNFGTIADAPGGVQRLRDLVLNLGLSGRLTEQTSAEGSVSQLLADAQQVLFDALQRGEIQKPIEPRAIQREPYGIPSTWSWMPLGSLVAVLDFRRKPVKKEERLARVRNKAPSDLYPYYGATQQAGVIDDFLFDEELVLLGEDGAPFLTPGKHVAYVVSGKFWVNNHAHVLRGVAVQHRYLAHALNQIDYSDFVTGTTRLKLTQGRMVHLPIPVPPFAEQKRIVAKVDELMKLCDALNDRQEHRRRSTTQYRRSALHALTAAETASDLHRAWERASTSWPALTDHPDSVTDLRRTILELAVRGKLSSQDLNDEPAGDLLTHIAEKQLGLRDQGKLRGVRLPPPAPSLQAPPLPPTWEWTTLGSVLKHCRNGTAATPNDHGVGYPLLRISAATSDADGIVNLDDHKFAHLEEAEAAPYVLETGDLLACRFNGNLHFVGRVAIVPARHGTYLHPDKLIRLKAISVDHRFLMIALNSLGTRRQIEGVASTTAGNIGINGAQLQALHIPLPPLAEQRRISERVGILFDLCTQLEICIPARDRRADQTATALIDSLCRAG